MENFTFAMGAAIILASGLILISFFRTSFQYKEKTSTNLKAAEQKCIDVLLSDQNELITFAEFEKRAEVICKTIEELQMRGEIRQLLKANCEEGSISNFDLERAVILAGTNIRLTESLPA